MTTDSKRARYLVKFVLAGTPYWFTTVASSESKAISNTIAQFAKQVNMSVAALRSYIKTNKVPTTATLSEG
jgi:hypothetical protein